MNNPADPKAIMGILKRQEQDGVPHISEAEMGRELGSDAQEVTEALRKLQQEGSVSRTADGNWELTPAAATKVTALPDAKQPRQG